VCGNSESFSAIGNTFTATGFNNPFAPGDGSLTLTKNGLGENQTGPGTACTSADCGIAHLFGVGVVASGNPINDVIITGVDPGETFNFFAGATIVSAPFIATFDSTCAGPVAGTCLITGFGDAAAVSVEMNTEGTIFVAAVSATAGTVPEPSTWAMLLLGFAGLGYAGWRRKSVRLVNV
jgi:hypothetical protein